MKKITNAISEGKKLLKNIKRRKIYKNEKYASKIEKYASTHDLNRKGAEKRLSDFAKKEAEKKMYNRPAKPEKKYKLPKTQPTRGLRGGEKFTHQMDTKLFNRIYELQTRANKKAKSAGLDYNYNFSFASKEGAMKYLKLLENIDANPKFFEGKAESRNAQFVENIKSAFGKLFDNASNSDDRSDIAEILEKLNDLRTKEDLKGFYNDFKKMADAEGFDAAQIAIIFFNSDGPEELNEDILKGIQILKKLLK